jgi:hypothetical protein
MRPYYNPGNYMMKTSVGYLMRMTVNRVLPQMEALFQDQELTFSHHHGRRSGPQYLPRRRLAHPPDRSIGEARLCHPHSQ